MTAAEPGALSEEEFVAFRDYFWRATGIYFEDNKRYFVDRRLHGRMRATGHNSWWGYSAFLQAQPTRDELQQLINTMTVNETSFFREEYQLKSMVEEILDDVLRYKPRKPVRIWSMPCSTGEEPYSIAIYLLEHWPAIEDVEVQIVGSDIDSNVLESARKGVYDAYSLRNLSEALRRKYFKPVGNNRFAINDDLRDAVTFTRVNITSLEETRDYRDFDLVFCRNLLIYFDAAKRREAVQALYSALNPGGYVFLGHSESMARISSLFRVARASHSLIYQKPLGDGA